MANGKPFHLPHTEGEFSRQAHVNPPRGTFERELGSEGFFGAATMMYHRNPPTAWSDISGPLRPRAFDLKTTAPSPSVCHARPVVHSSHMRLRYWVTSQSTGDLFRNADGDDLLFVHQGSGDFFCDYGHLAYEAGDYIVVPRGTMWRLETTVHCEFLLIEATEASYGLPERGMLGPHALFDPAILDRPRLDAAFQGQARGGTWQLIIKRHNELTTVTYPFNPLDTVGWQGNRCALRLNVRDFRPVTSESYHLPPSVATTFLTDKFIVCTLAPRLIETDPKAVKLPFWHNNDDYEELVFNHRGTPGSHRALGEGMMTFHPIGMTHGRYPERMPGLFEAPVKKNNTYGVMIDSRVPLHFCDGMAEGEYLEYADSWRAGIEYAPDAQRAPGQALKTVMPAHEPAQCAPDPMAASGR
jgi:homogentisate 1,2-dioxygenase